MKDDIKDEVYYACQSFMNWAQGKKIELIALERVVYSKKERYAGTLDIDCIVDGVRSIIEIKTSTAIYDDYWYQLALYRMAYEIELGIDFPGSRILRLSKDKVEFEEEFMPMDWIEDYYAGIGLKRAYDRGRERAWIKQQIKKEAKANG